MRQSYLAPICIGIGLILPPLLFNACGESPKQKAAKLEALEDQKKALPHTSYDKQQPLTDAEQQKLIQASGRSAEPLNGAQLQQKINFYPGLQVVIFWSDQSPVMDSILTDIRNLPPDLRQRVRIQHVIADMNMDIASINLLIRQFGVTDPVYQIMDEQRAWMSRLHADADTTVSNPAIWIYHQDQELSLWYPSQLSAGALQVILESLSL